MSGFGLIHVGFLAAAAAVSIPILIHLLLKPRVRPMDIGTLRFLKLVLKDSTRRRKLRRWLLLALRAAAVLLLALLFTRPYHSGAGSQGTDREVILLVDQSASMRATHSGRTLFDLAQEAATEILDNLPEGTAAHLAYFDDRGVATADEVRIDRRREPGYAGTDYGEALCWARDLTVLSSRSHRKVFVFCDLQRNGLQPTECEGFPADVEVEVIEVGTPEVANLAVEKAQFEQTTVRPQQPIVVSASALNTGLFSAEEVRVRLALEGDTAKPIEKVQTISIAPGSREFARFSLPIEEPGLYQGYVELISDDDFALDNRRWLAVDARTPDRILLVDGEPGRTVYANETYYLETALRLTLSGEGKPLTPYEPERLAIGSEVRLPLLTPYRVVVLCNVAGLADTKITRLQSFVASGGSLLVFTGSQVQPARYQGLHQAGLLPAAVEQTSEAGEFRFDTWDENHPVFRPLSDPQQGDLRRVVLRQITRLKPRPDAKVLAVARTGDPLLVEWRLDRGVVTMFACSADRDWSDWPQGRLYVPLVHQMVAYLTDRLEENQRVRHEPAGQAEDNPPGIREDGSAVLVRNINAEESEFERCSEREFREKFQLSELDAATKTQQASTLPLPPGAERPDELWRYVIWVLLIVLVLEVFVANRTHA